MTDPPDRLVLWQARGGGAGLAELAGVFFGCGCLIVLAVLVLRRLQQGLPIIVPVVIFGLALTLRAAGSIRGRVAVSGEGLEVRRVLTRLYGWSSLNSVELDEGGRIEINPNGWVRHLPIPKRESEAAYRTLLSWRERFTP